jgi:hypothetical protein
VPDKVAKRLKYTNQKDVDPPRATLQVTGILTVNEVILAKSLSSVSGRSDVIDRTAKQPSNIVNGVLSGIFTDVDTAKQLLNGDVISADDSDPNTPTSLTLRLNDSTS